MLNLLSNRRFLMKILLITFDKEMENKIKQLLKEHNIAVAKNGEEAILSNITDIDAIIYDALAGGIAEEDINKLYDSGYKDVPYIVLMDELFPIDPDNLKPKNKKILAREGDLDKLPKVVQELLGAKPATEEAGKEEKVETAVEQPMETVAEAPQEVTTTTTEEKKGIETTEDWWKSLVEETPAAEQKEETAATVTVEEEKVDEGTVKVPEEEKVEIPPAEIKTEGISEEKPIPSVAGLKKCLLVSFDIPLVEKIEQLIGDKCELYTARSAKQALQKYGHELFDVIIFDTISGVFAEKGIKDLYEKGGYKDSLYVLLLDEFAPIDIDKLPVKNMRAIKRDSELNLLPEIIENAPIIGGGAPAVAEEKEETVVIIPPPEEATTEKTPTKEEIVPETPIVPPAEAKAKEEVPTIAETEPAIPTEEVKEKPVPKVEKAIEKTVAVDEKLIEQIVEKKITEKLLPIIEDIVRTKLSDTYLKTLLRETLEEEINCLLYTSPSPRD
jgi:hypothetical protein